jgi:hypothetical protein
MTTLNLQTRLYKVDDEEAFNGGKREQGMSQFDLPLSTTKEMSWEAKRVNVPGSFTRGNVDGMSLCCHLMSYDNLKTLVHSSSRRGRTDGNGPSGR